MYGRAFALMFVGALGGALAWAVSEPFAPRMIDAPTWAAFERIFNISMGCFIGGLIGFVSGRFQGSRTHSIRGLILGLIVGLVVGPIAGSVGSAAFNSLTGGVGALGGGPIVFVARLVGWGIFGALLGLGLGAIGRSTKRAIQGLIGGGLGGIVGGFAFEMAAVVVAPLLVTPGAGVHEVGTIPRAVGLTCVGAGIGLFIGLADAYARTAWIRLMLGRNEGRDWSLDWPTAYIGRDERAHIPLFGDMNVAPHHATIVRQGAGYWVHDAGTPIGIGLNGQRVQGSAPLNNGDVIQVAGHQLQFLSKGPRPQYIPTAAPAQVDPRHAVSSAPVNVLQPTVAMPAAGGGMATLVATGGPLAGMRFPVVGTMFVGREASAIPVEFDSLVSRRHASLEPQGMGVLVTDHGSTNGTLVNGQRVQSTLANPGDTVQIGSTVFRVE